MRGWLLDTNVIAALIHPAGAPSVKAWARSLPESSLFISILTIAEYDKGIHHLPEDHRDRDRHKAARNALVERFDRRILGLDDPIVLRWGRLSGDIKRRTGHPPPVVDTLLAATAIEQALYLATRNVKDVRHSGAIVFDPWSDEPSKFPLNGEPPG